MNTEPYGCIYQKSGRYYARIYYYKGTVRRQKSFPTGIASVATTKRKIKQQEKAAQEVLNALLQEFTVPSDKKATAPLSEQLFSDAVKVWLERQRGQKAPSTLAGYQHAGNDIITYFSEICPIRTTELTSAMIEDYLAWERRRRQPDYEGPYKKRTKYTDGSGIENTVLHRLTLIRSVLQSAKRYGVVTTNAASSRDSWISIPKPQQHLFPVFTQEEAQHFISLLKDEELWFRVAVLLALLLGLRRSEVIGIREQDIDMQQGQLEVRHTVTQQTIDGVFQVTARPFTKNRRPKRFPLSAELSACLQALMDEAHHNAELFGASYNRNWDGYLFRYPDGNLVPPNTLTQKFDAFITKVSDKRLRYHDLRHSCASILYASGVSLKTIQEVLGHAQLTTTISYTHLYGQEKYAALGLCQELCAN